MKHKTVWAHVSIDVSIDGSEDDEALMDIIHDELVEYGFIIDDMGVRVSNALIPLIPHIEKESK